MNLILLEPADWIDASHARVCDPRRLTHLREVHRAAPGDSLTVGALDGAIGRGELLALSASEALFHVPALDREPRRRCRCTCCWRCRGRVCWRAASNTSPRWG